MHIKPAFILSIILLIANINENSLKNRQIQATSYYNDSLYRYFSKEEIQEKISRATEVLTKHCSDDTVSYMSKYQKLLEEDNFAVPLQKIKEVWGTPINVTKEQESISGNNYDAFSCLYHQFYLSNITMKDNFVVNYISTNVAGFGFAGVYVGIPECNKNYIKTLFKKAEFIGKHKFNKQTLWAVTIEASTRSYLYIEFDKKNVVKKITFEARSPVY